jgi:hypothetical protein
MGASQAGGDPAAAREDEGVAEMTLARAKRVLGRSVAVAGLAVVVATGAGAGAALAEKGSTTTTISPLPGSWRMCTFYSNMYLEFVFEAVHEPEPGVDYDALLADIQKDIDRACTQFTIEVS